MSNKPADSPIHVIWVAFRVIDAITALLCVTVPPPQPRRTTAARRQEQFSEGE